jgi:hypothetical protein
MGADSKDEQRFTLRVPRDLYERFQAHAKREQRSVNAQLWS